MRPILLRRSAGAVAADRIAAADLLARETRAIARLVRARAGGTGADGRVVSATSSKTVKLRGRISSQRGQETRLLPDGRLAICTGALQKGQETVIGISHPAGLEGL